MTIEVPTLISQITLEKLLSYPDGTWILTDAKIMRILDTACWSEPWPPVIAGRNGLWWRRNQLLDQFSDWVMEPNCIEGEGTFGILKAAK